MNQQQIEWRQTEEGLVPYMGDLKVIWTPQPPSQTAFLECPVFEVLLAGNRGGGKTDALLMDFAQHVGEKRFPEDKRGYGREWRGILFRQSFPELADVITKTKKWFPQVFPQATFNESKVTWEWPTGETLRLSYMETEDDYWHYHGHAYPWIGFEELTTWADDRCYRIMFACSRSTRLGMPRKYRSTTNSYGPGHNWVRSRFKLPIAPGRVTGDIITEETSKGTLRRVAIRAMLSDNKALLAAEPNYLEKVLAAASNPAQAKAWSEDDWNIVAGGMFDDVWSPVHHIVPDIPFGMIPSSWKMNRSYDHGQSRPFSVGWWAESSGEPIELTRPSGQKVRIGTVRGDVIRIAEWYGCKDDRPNEGLRLLSTEIADGIRERQINWGIDRRVRRGPADTNIFDDYEPGKSVAGDMARRGVRWSRADKRPGSRKHGWAQIREFLKAAVPGVQGIREHPGLFICERCEAFIRTVPTLPRDKKDPDDVDTKAEDHVADEVRYRLRERARSATVSDF